MLQAAQSHSAERNVECVSPLLQEMFSNAKKNMENIPQQGCREEVLKKFATSLFIYSGPMAYHFIHQNLPEVLPLLRTVQRIVSHKYQPLHEGEFRFDELLVHLNAYKAPKVAIGEDATHLISGVEV